MLSPEELKTPEQLEKEKLDSEIIAILDAIVQISAKELINRLRLDWRDEKMKHYLDNMQQVEKLKNNNRIYYRIKGKAQPTLF